MPAQIANLNEVFGQFLSVALSLMGITSMVMILVSGFSFLSAGGNKEATAKAQHTLTYAIVGLVVAIAAWTIMATVARFLGIQIQVFNIMVN